MAEVKVAIGPSLSDIKIDLGKADEVVKEDSSAGGDTLPDIPIEEATTDQSKNQPTPGEDIGGDFGSDFGADEPAEEAAPEAENPFGGEEVAAAPAPAPQPDKSADTKQKIKDVVNEIDKATFETELTTVKTIMQRLQNENDLLHTRLKEFKKEFQEQILFRIPKYQEIELPSSRFNPEYIMPYIGNALDKLFIKVFKDVPMYDFQTFDIIDKDQDGNITNALVKVAISFGDASPFRPLKFSLELWIISGFLQIPQWFKYQNSIYSLTEQGIRSLDFIANRLDETEARNKHDYQQENWYTVNRDQRNPAIPTQVEIPMSQHTPHNVWVNHRPY